MRAALAGIGDKRWQVLVAQRPIGVIRYNLKDMCKIVESFREVIVYQKLQSYQQASEVPTEK